MFLFSFHKTFFILKIVRNINNVRFLFSRTNLRLFGSISNMHFYWMQAKNNPCAKKTFMKIHQPSVSLQGTDMFTVLYWSRRANSVTSQWARVPWVFAAGSVVVNANRRCNSRLVAVMKEYRIKKAGGSSILVSHQRRRRIGTDGSINWQADITSF